MPDWRNLDITAIHDPVVDSENYFYAATITFSAAPISGLKAGGVIITYKVTGP